MRFSHIARTLVLAMALAFGAVQPALAIVFPWPNPDKHPFVMLTADQSIGDYLTNYPERFDQDFVVGGLYIDNVTYGDSDAAMANYAGLYSRLFRKHIVSGTYISGTTVLHELSLTRYPADAVSIEDLSLKTRYLGQWTRDHSQLVVDLSDVKSRNGLDAEIGNLWRHVHTIMRFVDNAAIHPRVARMQPWAAYCANITNLRQIAESLHGNAIFNIFARPWEMSELETKQLMDAVAGNGANAVSFVLPWSKKIKDDKNAQGWAIYRYRQMLKRHIVVILMPSDDAPPADLFKWMASWKRPNERVYIAKNFWDE